jgi:hypothetical protein
MHRSEAHYCHLCSLKICHRTWMWFSFFLLDCCADVFCKVSNVIIHITRVVVLEWLPRIIFDVFKYVVLITVHEDFGREWC